MKNILLTSLFFLFFKCGISQNIFNEAIGGVSTEEALFSNTTTDGGYIVVGWTKSFGAGNWDLYLVKTNAQGAVLWTKTYGGPGDEVDCSVEQTTDGGYIIASRTNSFGSGSADVFLVKTDSTGELQWSKTYGGTDWEEGHSVIQSSDGGYVHTGYTQSFGAGGQDIYLIKNDSNGELEWIKTFGSGGDERGHKIKQAPDGGYIIAAETNSFGAGGWDFYLIKTDIDGNLEWAKTYGGAGDEFGWDVRITNDGGYIFTGFTDSYGAGGRDFCLLKIDVNGNVQWAKTYGGSLDDESYSVQQTSDGGYFMTGETSSFGQGDEDIFVIKTDSDGNVSWAKTYGGNDEDGSQFGMQTPDNGFIISGYTNSFGAGDWDFYLVKTDEYGNSNGCNETNPVPTVNNISLVAVNSGPQTLIGTGGIRTNPATAEGTGGTLSFCTPALVNENQFTNLEATLYPNPSNEKITILNSSLFKNASFKIVNMLGEEVMTSKLNQNEKTEINIVPLNKGIYFLQIIQNGQLVTNKKLIKL